MQEKIEFSVRAREKKKDIPIAFMFICGVFIAWQVLLTNLSKINLWGSSFEVDFNTLAIVLMCVSVVGFVLAFAFSSYNALMFKILVCGVIMLNLLALLPFGAKYLEIMFYLTIVFSQIASINFVFVVVSNYSVGSAFADAFASLITGGLTYAFLYTNFALENYIVYILVGVVSGVCLFAYFMKLFDNKKVIKYEPKVLRKFSKEERKNNPMLEKKQRILFPTKLTTSVGLLLLISVSVAFLTKQVILAKELDFKWFYICASIGAFVLGVLFKKFKHFVLVFSYASLAILMVGVAMLFSDNAIVANIGMGCCGFFLSLFSLSIFYTVSLFEEVPSKAVISFLIVVELISNFISSKILEKTSIYSLLTIILVLIGILIIVLAIYNKYLSGEYYLSKSGDVYENIIKNTSITLTEGLVYQLMISGYTRSQVAEMLYLRKDSVTRYMVSILNKLGANNIVNKYFKAYKE